MEAIHLDRNTAVAAGLLGLCSGFAVGYLVCRRSYGMRLDSEISAAKSHYQSRLKSEVTKLVAVRATSYNGPGEEAASAVGDEYADEELPGEGLDGPLVVDNYEIARTDNESRSTGLPGMDTGGPAADQVWPPVNRDRSKPYVISEAEFSDSEIGTQQLTITYYQGDKILVDDKEQPIRDIRGVTGPVVPGGFGGISGDPSIRYVRNERLEIDFEIVLDQRSYTDVVLNYGNPNRRE